MSNERLTLEQAKARVAELCAKHKRPPINVFGIAWDNVTNEAARLFGEAREAPTFADEYMIRGVAFVLLAYDRQLAYDEGYSAKGENVAEELDMCAESARNALASGSTKWFAPDWPIEHVRAYADIVTKLAAEERAGEILRGVP